MSAGRRGARSWQGRKVLITGGSSGIGKHLAGTLLRQGAHVAIVAHDPSRLEAAAAELARLSPHVWAHVCDVGHRADIEAMAQAYRARFGAPDVVVNNAGYALYYTFDQLPAAEIERLIDVNFTGAALVTRAFLPDMIAAGGGDVVMVASIAGRIPMTPCGVYSAAKHGMVSLAELLRVETARFGVRVHVVCPGRVETSFFAHESFRQRAHRPETARTIPIEAVSRAIVAAVDHDRRFQYVPRHYGVLVWLTEAAPLAFRPLWHRLMRARVDAAAPRPGESRP